MPPIPAADTPQLFVLDEPAGEAAGPAEDGAAAERRQGPQRRPSRRRGSRRPVPVLLAVDGNGLAHRAFHAVGGAGAPPGEARQRVLGMLARIAFQSRNVRADRHR